jgi:hypothetical protein
MLVQVHFNKRENNCSFVEDINRKERNESNQSNESSNEDDQSFRDDVVSGAVKERYKV